MIYLLPLLSHKAGRLLLGVIAAGIALYIAVSTWQFDRLKKAVHHEVETKRQPSIALTPPLSTLRWRVENGVQTAEAHIGGGRDGDRVYLYRPIATTAKRVPCVVVAPAGTRMFHGVFLSDEDRAEHFPYAEAGFAVVAYELDGPLSEYDMGDVEAVNRATRQFADADAGIANARAALLLARNLPWVDPKRVFVAGHSSAGRVALQVAAFEPSHIAGCVAYAPGLDGIGGNGDAGQRIATLSPQNVAPRLTRPLFLFVARDDSVIRSHDVDKFADMVRKNNSHVTLETVLKGDHYDAMAAHGIPLAIEWMKKQP